jgi:hypothetical protein
MVDRIRALLTLRQLTPTQFADLIQVGRPIVSHILSGRNKASLEVVQRIITAFPEVALPWLLSGTGPMLAAISASVPAVPSEDPTVHTPAAAPDTVRAAAVPAETDVQAPSKAARATSSQPVSVSDGDSSVHPLAKAQARAPLPGHTSYPKPRKFRVSGVKPNVSVPSAAVTDDLPGAPATAQSAPVEVAAQQAAFTLPIEKPSSSNTVTPTPYSYARAVPPSPQITQSGDSTMPQSPLGEVGGHVTNVPTASSASQLFTADKPIRRIVIFYRDGSFSDFQPEG